MIITLTLLTAEGKDKSTIVQDLILDIAEGDQSAIGSLYDEIKTDVFAYALSKVKNRFDAEDIMQDTFVNVYKYARQYVPKNKPMAWIITIEHNLIKRYFALRNRTVQIDEKVMQMADDVSIEGVSVNNAYLKQLLSSLSEEEREIITLHVVSGLKHREIAMLTDKPLSTVLSQYNRAIKKLKQIEEGN